MSEMPFSIRAQFYAGGGSCLLLETCSGVCLDHNELRIPDARRPMLVVGIPFYV